MAISVTAAGQIGLAAVTSLAATVSADGSSSQISLPGLTTTSANTFTASNGATIALAFSITSATATLTIASSKQGPVWNASGAALTAVLPGTYSLTARRRWAIRWPRFSARTLRMERIHRRRESP